MINHAILLHQTQQTQIIQPRTQGKPMFSLCVCGGGKNAISSSKNLIGNSCNLIVFAAMTFSVTVGSNIHHARAVVESLEEWGMCV